MGDNQIEKSMLKYQTYKIVFQEIPDEVSLAIAISGCQIRCAGCHSRELWEDKGILLGMTEFQWLLNQNEGISCVLLMGGEHNIDALTELFMYAHQRLKTAWYCGLDRIPKDKQGALDYLDYLKLGHYDMELGGLDSPNTNQRLYQFDHYFNDCTEGLGAGWRDITYKLQKK